MSTLMIGNQGISLDLIQYSPSVPWEIMPIKPLTINGQTGYLVDSAWRAPHSRVMDSDYNETHVIGSTSIDTFVSIQGDLGTVSFFCPAGTRFTHAVGPTSRMILQYLSYPEIKIFEKTISNTFNNTPYAWFNIRLGYLIPTSYPFSYWLRYPEFATLHSPPSELNTKN